MPTPTETVDPMVAPLIERLREAVQLGDVGAITARIKDDLESFIPAEGLRLPERFRRSKPDCYSRRLLYRDPDLGFTALIMTWAPGQRTALHDHAGIWCVEGVVEGNMEVTRYELLEQVEEDLFRFVERERLAADAGSAGALIPPLEHHVLGNPGSERVALTLHVYGGEMSQCAVFEPTAHGSDTLFRRRFRTLSYDE
jgi:predicted metal-dependent enzyme (double-stranded beta helix superfamily)